MRLSPEERAANRAVFRAMSLGQKTEYVLAYYKLPLVLLLVAAVAVGSIAHRLLTHKEPVLYVAFANVVPGDELLGTLTEGYLQHEGISPRTSEVTCYQDLYLATDATQQNHQYAYASKLKLMAAVDARQLDIVYMNKEAYDLLSAGGYLLDLQEWLEVADSELLAQANESLTANDVVLDDNRIELELGEADTYEATTVTQVNALRVGTLSTFSNAGFDDEIYLGVLINSPRLEAVRSYLAYLTELS